MKARCQRPAHPRYADYGGRGIRVCDRWLGPGGFSRFLADVGERPAGMTIDRIDPDGHYEPGNVKWSTLLEQRWNRRDMAHAHAQTEPAIASSWEPAPAPAMPF